MSRCSNKTMEKLMASLDLDKLADNHFMGHAADYGWQRIFGGQTISQSLVAALRTVPDQRYINSLHAYFVRWGDPNEPVEFEVTPIRDGVSFSLRSVTAKQKGQTILTLQASFQKHENGYSHQIAMPDVPMPEDINVTDALTLNKSGAATELKQYLEKERPFIFRPVSWERFLKNGPLEPDHALWFKLLEPVEQANDPHMSAIILAYISDALLIDTALFPHGTNIFDGSLQAGSLDHAVWFHRPFKLDDWMLYHMDSPSAFGARGFARGNLFQKDGTLIASVAQQGLIRKRANAK